LRLPQLSSFHPFPSLSQVVFDVLDFVVDVACRRDPSFILVLEFCCFHQVDLDFFSVWDILVFFFWQYDPHIWCELLSSAVGMSPALLVRRLVFLLPVVVNIQFSSCIDLKLASGVLVVPLVPSLSSPLQSSCSLSEPVPASDLLSCIVCTLGRPELLPVGPCRVCHSCTRRSTLSWTGMPLFSISVPDIAVIVYRRRHILRHLLRSWLVPEG